jgi:hypothetical protein
MESSSRVAEGNRTPRQGYKKAQEGVSAGGSTRDILAAGERYGRLLPDRGEIETAQVIVPPYPTTELESFDPVSWPGFAVHRHTGAADWCKPLTRQALSRGLQRN